jgi:hypothetical protein
MALPVVESVATGGNATPTSPLSVPLPSGISSGDLLIVFVSNGSSRTATTPTGWTLVAGTSNSGGFYRVYQRIADGTEGSTLSVTLSNTANFNSVAFRISGHNATTPVNVSATDNTSNNVVSPSVTTTVENCLVLRMQGIARDRTFTVPTSHTLQGTATTGGLCDISVASIAQSTSGSTGAATWTVSGGSADFTSHIVAAIAGASGGVAGPVLFHSHYQNQGWR